jgi:hypothetical protein
MENFQCPGRGNLTRAKKAACRLFHAWKTVQFHRTIAASCGGIILKDSQRC